MADRSIAKPAPIPEDSIPKGEDYPPPADPPVTRQPVPVAFSSDDDDMISAILLIIITLFLPPVGVLIVAGCGADFCINLCLTILGFFPGHIHAFYVEYIYFKRRDEARMGIYNARPAPAIYSERVLRGGEPLPPNPPPAQPGYGTMPPPQRY